MTTRDVSSALRKVKMPPDVLTIGSGDPDELSEFITQLGYLAATCATTDCQISSTELAVIAYEYGWTAEVIIHILNGVLKDVSRDEKLLVLSLYDGIGTGRYCLNKMGFTNVEYHAYEIDKYAIQVAMSNYPDIIQHGDAFQVRNEKWTVKKND